MSFQPTDPKVFEEPPEGWCDELFCGEPTETEKNQVAPIVRWYNCRLPKGHEGDQHSCFAFRLGK